jgi:hypothetical protein
LRPQLDGAASTQFAGIEGDLAFDDTGEKLITLLGTLQA